MTTRCVWGDVGVCVHMCVCVCVCMRAYVCVLVHVCVHFSAVGVLHCIWVQLCVDSLVSFGSCVCCAPGVACRKTPPYTYIHTYTCVRVPACAIVRV